MAAGIGTREEDLLRLARAAASPDPLLGLRALSELRRRLDAYERRQIRLALLSGQSFADVARARGVSRQAAHRQYRQLVEHPPQRRLRWDDGARRVLQLARREAAFIGADAVGGVDILLALVATGDLPHESLERARVLAARRRRQGTLPTRLDPTVLDSLRWAGAIIGARELLDAALEDPAARDLLDRLS